MEKDDKEEVKNDDIFISCHLMFKYDNWRTQWNLWTFPKILRNKKSCTEEDKARLGDVVTQANEVQWILKCLF